MVFTKDTKIRELPNILVLEDLDTYYFRFSWLFILRRLSKM